MRLFSPDPPEAASGSLPEPPTPPTETPPQGKASKKAALPPASPPPAAKVVLDGKRTERELKLEKTLRQRETRISELEDENRTLKAVPAPKPARSAPEPAPETKSWLSGATFFDGV